MRYLSLFFLILFSAFFLLQQPVKAQSFTPGFILSDSDLFGADTMTVEEIQAFLDQHRGVLKDYHDVDVDGHLKTAAMMIHDAAERHQINPKYLIVLLQKEQGLLTDPEPYDTQLHWATGYALCDSCEPDHPIVIKYKGFASQVDHAASRTRHFTENINDFHFKPGETYQIDGEEVTIKNLATAAMYNYTPHIQGNKILFKLWNSWFGSYVPYPDGTLLQAHEEDGVWLIKDGKRHPFSSLSALTTRYNRNNIIQVPKRVLGQYERGAEVTYPEYALLKTPSEKIYMLVDNKKRLIVDDFTFRQLGFTEDEIIEITDTELAFFERGKDITTESLEPLGSLIQDPETYGIYYVKDGVKKPLLAPELMSLNFSHLQVRKGTKEELERYKKGSPVLIKDGYLVKTRDNPKVYVISNGKKHPIDSEDTFHALGYDMNNIHIVSEKLLLMHEKGDEITLTELTDEEADDLVEPIQD